MSAKTKTPKLKPRRMWANYYPDRYFALHPTKRRALRSYSSNASHVSVPVVVIPLDDVEGLARKAFSAYLNAPPVYCTGNCVRHALRAIGIPVPVKKEGRK